MADQGTARQAGGTSLRGRAANALAEYRAQEATRSEQAASEATAAWAERALRVVLMYGLSPETILDSEAKELRVEGLRFIMTWHGTLCLVGPVCPRCESQPFSEEIRNGPMMLKELGETIEQAETGQVFAHECFPKAKPPLQEWADKAALTEMVREKISLIDTYAEDGALETALDRMEELLQILRPRPRVTDTEMALIEAVGALIEARLPGG